MKKAMLSVAVMFAALTITSCGDDKEGSDESEKGGSPAGYVNEDDKEDGDKEGSGSLSVCDCVSMGEDMVKEMKDAGDDEDKLKEIEEKYKEKAEECEKMAEDMSEEDAKKAMEDCK